MWLWTTYQNGTTDRPRTRVHERRWTADAVATVSRFTVGGMTLPLLDRQSVVTFRARGVPQPQGSMRAFVPKGWRRAVITSDNPKLGDWRRLVAAAAPGRVPFDGAVRVTLHFDLPRPRSLPRRVVDHVKRPDLDKMARGCLDALTGVLFRDDSQVVELRATKGYGVEVGVTVMVEEVRV